MLRCPECNADTKVLRNDRQLDATVMRRRRECSNGHRFWTFERIVESKKPKANKEVYKPRRHHNYGNREPQAGILGDCIGSPRRAKDAEKYACLKEGYSHRPLPRGQNKREAFCSICEAGHCYFRAYMTPEEVRNENKQLPPRPKQLGFSPSGDPWTDLANSMLERVVNDIEGYDIKLGFGGSKFLATKRKIMREAEEFLASPMGQYWLDGASIVDVSVSGIEIVEMLRERRRR